MHTRQVPSSLSHCSSPNPVGFEQELRACMCPHMKVCLAQSSLSWSGTWERTTSRILPDTSLLDSHLFRRACSTPAQLFCGSVVSMPPATCAAISTSHKRGLSSRLGLWGWGKCGCNWQVQREKGEGGSRVHWFSGSLSLSPPFPGKQDGCVTDVSGSTCMVPTPHSLPKTLLPGPGGIVGREAQVGLGEAPGLTPSSLCGPRAQKLP